MSTPNKKKRHEKKKKRHEKESRAKILALRQARQQVVKVPFEGRKQVPICNEDFYKAKELLAAEIKANLQSNMDVLKSLEAEYALENPGKSLIEETERNLANNELVKSLS